MKTAHHWSEPHPILSLCVAPPLEAGGRWQSWVRSLDVKDREFVSCTGAIPGYWKLNQNLYQPLSRQCIEAGWILLPGRPPGLRGPRRRGRAEEEQPAPAPDKPLPFEDLFLLPNAPKFVATAAFNALAKKYHPDRHSGTPEKDSLAEKMQIITNAKAEIWKARGW